MHKQTQICLVGGSLLFRLCSGEEVLLVRKKNTIVVTHGGDTIALPTKSPFSGRPMNGVWHDTPNSIVVYYESSWPEFQAMTCAGAVVLVTKTGLAQLPDVKPETFVYPDTLSQFMIAQVERSPFGVPCAALLAMDTFASDGQVHYVFPTEEPIILEGTAATNASGRIHDSLNCPGMGATYGDVPCIYPWVSPNEKRHGWALALYEQWEVHGKERPPWEKVEVVDKGTTTIITAQGERDVQRHRKITPSWIADRSVLYDPSDDDELYDIRLGGNDVEFSLLGFSARPFFAYKREAIEATARASRDAGLARKGTNNACRCPS